jgi:sensor histidine kinase YesM
VELSIVFQHATIDICVLVLQPSFFSLKNGNTPLVDLKFKLSSVKNQIIIKRNKMTETIVGFHSHNELSLTSQCNQRDKGGRRCRRTIRMDKVWYIIVR